MKRTALALISAFCLLGASPAFGQTNDDPFLKRFVKIDSLLENTSIVEDLLSDYPGGAMDLGVKPNVNMIVSESVKENGTSRISVTPFSAVKKGQKLTPHIYYLIDNAPLTDALYSKIVILDPKNVIIYSSPLDVVNTQAKGTALVGIKTLGEISFDRTGEYKIQFYIKLKNGESSIKIGQTVVKSN